MTEGVGIPGLTLSGLVRRVNRIVVVAGGIRWREGPGVGMRAAVEPWAGGRNPVGIGRGDGFGIGGHRRDASQGRPFVQANPGLGDATLIGL
jgi:hypothetical protein